jgi:hypothetical protein
VFNFTDIIFAHLRQKSLLQAQKSFEQNFRTKKAARKMLVKLTPRVKLVVNKKEVL